MGSKFCKCFNKKDKFKSDDEESKEADDGPRKVERIDCYDIEDHKNLGWIKIDGDYLTIKKEIGAGAFCKVREATISAVKNVRDEQ